MRIFNPGLLLTGLIFCAPTTACAEDVIRADSLQSSIQAEQQAEAALSNAKNVLRMAKDIDDTASVAVATEAVRIASDALKKARKHRREDAKVEAMRLQQAGATSAVQIKDPPTATADPSFFTRPRARLHIRYVPDPMQAPRDTWLHYVKSDRAGLILDALEEGKGDLEQSIAYLDGQIIRHGSNRTSSSALSYLEGLRLSYIAAGAEYHNKSAGNGQDVTLESKALLQAIMVATDAPMDVSALKQKQTKPDSSAAWRIDRGYKLLTVLKATSGDLEKSYQMLRSDKDIIVAGDAEYYLRGSYAYWDFLATKEATR